MLTNISNISGIFVRFPYKAGDHPTRLSHSFMITLAPAFGRGRAQLLIPILYTVVILKILKGCRLGGALGPAITKFG